MNNYLKVSLPLPPSVNHYYFTTKTGKRIMTDRAREWMDEAKWLVRFAADQAGWKMLSDTKIIMRMWIYWPDRRRRDTGNLHKAIADAPEGIAYEDDRWVLIRDMDFSVDKDNPRIEMILEEAI